MRVNSLKQTKPSPSTSTPPIMRRQSSTEHRSSPSDASTARSSSAEILPSPSASNTANVSFSSPSSAAWASAAISSSRIPDPSASASISASSASLETTLLRAISRSALVTGAGFPLAPDADGGRTVRGVVTVAHSSDEDDAVEPKEALLPFFDLVLLLTSFLAPEEPKNGTPSFMAVMLPSTRGIESTR
uniref:Uncharacterized protein n=1 Tax=Setaria italica TaxID=4555 RepID=K3ZJZ2_SETIT